MSHIVTFCFGGQSYQVKVNTFMPGMLIGILALVVPSGSAVAQEGRGCLQDYVVKTDDTLAEIASAHGTTYIQLMQTNGISNANLIYVGQVLCIVPETPGQGVIYVTATPSVPAAQGLGAVQNNPSQTNPNLVPSRSEEPTGPTFGFNDANEKATDLNALDPAHRGVWEPVHWFLLFASLILVAFNLRVRWNGSKLDLIGAIASVVFAFVVVFVDAGEAGIWVTLVVYLTMLVLSFVGDDDFSSLGLMALLIAIIASFFGKMTLLNIDPGVSFRSVQDIPALWENLDFSNMTLSGAIYANLIGALLVFSREVWTELDIFMKRLENNAKAFNDRATATPKYDKLNFGELSGDTANWLLTFFLIIVWGFF